MGHILPEDGVEDLTPRKGRSNAIVTYETLARIDNRVAAIDIQMRQFVTGQSDHETRLRSLEGLVGSIIATSTTRRGDFQWVWQAVFTLLSAGMLLASYFKGTH